MGRLTEFYDDKSGVYLTSKKNLRSYLDSIIDTKRIVKQIGSLEKLTTTNPEMLEKIRRIVSDDVWKARNSVVRNLYPVFLNGDPNEARRSIRRVVYRKIIGANLNIYNMRRGTAKFTYRQPERIASKIGQPKKRGGNRTRRTEKTARIQGYEPKARGFILRWVNAGTDERTTKYGYRGAIATRDFFEPAAKAALEVVAVHVCRVIEKEVSSRFNNEYSNL